MTPTQQAVVALTALYAPSAAAQAREMPEIGAAMEAQLVALTMDPSPERCLAVASNLDGARRAVLRLHEAVKREASDG
jgi:hypothetical protein